MIGREEVGRKRRKRGREAEMEGREIREGVLGSFDTVAVCKKVTVSVDLLPTATH